MLQCSVIPFQLAHRSPIMSRSKLKIRFKFAAKWTTEDYRGLQRMGGAQSSGGTSALYRRRRGASLEGGCLRLIHRNYENANKHVYLYKVERITQMQQLRGSSMIQPHRLCRDVQSQARLAWGQSLQRKPTNKNIKFHSNFPFKKTCNPDLYINQKYYFQKS